MRVLVAGAGLGGLAAGIAASRAGHDVGLYERAEWPRETGAGIGLMPNGVLALDALGAGTEVRRLASDLAVTGGLRDRRGRLLLGTDQRALTARTGAPVVVTARRQLHRLLADALPEDTVHAGAEVHRVHDTGDGGAAVRVETGAGDRTADLVIAADGAGSTVRGQLFPGHPGLAGTDELAARTLVRRPPAYGPTDLPVGELLDHRTGRRFGCIPMASDQVYWYASWRSTSATGPTAARPAAPADPRGWLLDAFADWHPAVPALVEAAEPGGVHVDPIVQLAEPLPSFAVGRVVLLGDAAHAMTPDLGQGACQAFEDAVALGEQLAGVRDADELPAALRRYDQLRRPRANHLLRASIRMNRMLTLSGPAARLRDLGLRAVPASLATLALLRQFFPRECRG